MKILKKTLKLDLPDNLRTHNIGSLFHGYIMEQLPTLVVENLHSHRYNPIKQRLFFDKENVYWQLISLETELCDILEKAFDPVSNIHLKRHNVKIPVLEQKTENIDLSDFVKSKMESDSKNVIKFTIISPMGFKNDGKYSVFPDIRLILRSIMLNFDYFSKSIKIYDYETLDYLAESIQFLDYHLSTTRFELEGVKIPSFKGNMVIKINANHNIKNLANLIFSYGELSGAGIKTSLGMGGILLKT